MDSLLTPDHLNIIAEFGGWRPNPGEQDMLVKSLTRMLEQLNRLLKFPIGDTPPARKVPSQWP